MEATMYIELANTAMLIVILVCSLTLKVKSMNNKWFFTSGIISLLIVNASDALEIYAALHGNLSCTIVFTFIAFLFTYIALLLFSFYLFGHFANKGFEVAKSYYVICILVTAIAGVVLFVNVFTDIYYRLEYNPDTNIIDYIRGPAYVVSQLIPLVSIGLSLIVTLNGRKQITKRELVIFLTYESMPLLVIFFNYLVPTLTWTYLIPPYLALVIFINNYNGEVVNYLDASTSQKNKLLISQIQPHFMFNTLNSIEYLYDDNPAMGKKMINSFTKYLRINLNNLSSDDLIPFDQELENIKTYLDIEKIRFGARLNVEFDIKDTEFDIPTLIIQPLVENAVKHGVCKKIEGGTVKLHTSADHNQILIIIEDDGVGFDSTQHMGKEHVGLFNIKQRLRNYFPHANIDIQSQVGVGTKITVKIPREDY